MVKGIVGVGEDLYDLLKLFFMFPVCTSSLIRSLTHGITNHFLRRGAKVRGQGIASLRLFHAAGKKNCIFVPTSNHKFI